MRPSVRKVRSSCGTVDQSAMSRNPAYCRRLIHRYCTELICPSEKGFHKSGAQSHVTPGVPPSVRSPWCNVHQFGDWTSLRASVCNYINKPCFKIRVLKCRLSKFMIPKKNGILTVLIVLRTIKTPIITFIGKRDTHTFIRQKGIDSRLPISFSLILKNILPL